MNMNYNYFTQFQKYKFTLKLINPIYVLNKTKNLKIPEKLKGTFLERWGN